jgi:predicted transport protein
MPLYRIHPNRRTLQHVERREFSSEGDLHAVVESNLTEMLGVRLIASEYPIPNGRIDSLGLDEDGIPVIIEYKWKKDLSAVVQGLFYLDWVMQNKKPFESIVRDKLGREVVVKWSTQPRLLIIEQDFDIKELAAINQMGQTGPRIELIKYSLYEGLFSYEYVNIVASKSPSPKTPADGEPPEYTLENIVKKASPDIRELFMELGDRILGISESVWEKVGSSYCDYRTTTTFGTVNVQKSRLKIFIKMGERKLNDPRGLSQAIPSNWGYGLLNTQFFISRSADIDYAMTLIMQAYEYVAS